MKLALLIRLPTLMIARRGGSPHLGVIGDGCVEEKGAARLFAPDWASTGFGCKMTPHDKLLQWSVLLCSLACLGVDCFPLPPGQEGSALVINQSDADLEVRSRWLLSCPPSAADQVEALTQGDFGPQQSDVIEARQMVAMNPCGVAWLEVGDFAGVVAWQSLEPIEIPEHLKLKPEFLAHAVLLEGTRDRPVVTIGSALQVFPVPKAGPPTLPAVPPSGSAP